jgi:Endonuclease-reverse transcriptase
MSRLFTPSTSITTSSPVDPNVLIIDIIKSKHKIQLLNIYNKQNQQPGNSISTIDRLFFNYTLYADSVLLGDFNTYYPWWDPLAKPSPRSEKLVTWIEDYQLELLNKPGKNIFFRLNIACPSVLDLLFATKSIREAIED